MKALIVAALAALALVAQVPQPAEAQISIRIPAPVIRVEPYAYSRHYHKGWWYGTYEGRRGYHRGLQHGRRSKHVVAKAPWQVCVESGKQWHDGRCIEQHRHGR